MIPIILNENDLDLAVDEIVDKEFFKKSETEIETYETIAGLKYRKDYDSDQPRVIISDDLKEKRINDSRVQAMFERSRLFNISVFFINQDYYELPKRTIRANGNVFLLFKLINFRVVQSLYQDKESIDITLN